MGKKTRQQYIHKDKAICFTCSQHFSNGCHCWAETANPSGTPAFIPVFSGVRVAQSLVFCIVFCISLSVCLSFFFWPLYCLSFELRLLITPLVSRIPLRRGVFHTTLYDKFISDLWQVAFWRTLCPLLIICLGTYMMKVIPDTRRVHHLPQLSGLKPDTAWRVKHSQTAFVAPLVKDLIQ
jgi:hypothetical protein